MVKNPEGQTEEPLVGTVTAPKFTDNVIFRWEARRRFHKKVTGERLDGRQSWWKLHHISGAAGGSKSRHDTNVSSLGFVGDQLGRSFSGKREANPRQGEPVVKLQIFMLRGDSLYKIKPSREKYFSDRRGIRQNN